MRKAPIIAITSALGLLLLGGSGTTWAEPSGQDLYKANCKVCHAAGSPQGEYTPLTLIQDLWEKFFKQKYENKHKDLDHPSVQGKKVVEAITPEMLGKIKKFAVDHAADSEQPMTCGK